MYKRVSWDEQAIGRRLIDRLPSGRAHIVPGVIPDLVAWLRMHGNRYVEMLSGMESKYATKGDGFMNHLRQVTEFRIALIQDLINLAVDEFPLRKWWEAVYTTCNELGIEDSGPKSEFVYPDPLFQDGEGI